MGLDMYLTKHIFIGAEYAHRQVKGTIDITAKGKCIPIDFDKVSYIIENVGYWRKANQIHRWFVENVQDGEDECSEHYVSGEKLLELKALCEKILAEQDPKKRVKLAKKHLPTQEGFFFGSQQYDEYYFSDLEETVKIINALKLDSESDKDIECSASYYYQSSW